MVRFSFWGLPVGSYYTIFSIPLPKESLLTAVFDCVTA